jgi:SAM-dependent methyltransferase
MAAARSLPANREIDPARMPGHWLLAKIGKCVLRPGGIQLTRCMLDALGVSADDDVVEFAPGLGLTAMEVLRSNPKTYTAVERDAAAAERLRKVIGAAGCILAPAENTVLPAQCASIVFGEAMLSMQTPERKSRIVREAFRLLRPGGRYAIHELCAVPEDLPESALREIERRMSLTIHVGVRLLTFQGWRELFEDAGFAVAFGAQAPMRLLEPGRVIRDEGIARTARIGWNLMRDRQARTRVRQMRRLFREYRPHLCAVTLIGRKP